MGSDNYESLNLSLYINGKLVNSSKTFSIYKNIPGFDEPGGMATSPNGDYLYVTNAGNNEVSIVNLTTDSIVKKISGFEFQQGNINFS